MEQEIKWCRNYDALRNLALWVFKMDYLLVGFTVTSDVINEYIEMMLDFNSQNEEEQQ